jgi:hypothetical protein
MIEKGTKAQPVKKPKAAARMRKEQKPEPPPEEVPRVTGTKGIAAASKEDALIAQVLERLKDWPEFSKSEKRPYLKIIQAFIQEKTDEEYMDVRRFQYYFLAALAKGVNPLSVVQLAGQEEITAELLVRIAEEMLPAPTAPEAEKVKTEEAKIPKGIKPDTAKEQALLDRISEVGELLDFAQRKDCDEEEHVGFIEKAEQIFRKIKEDADKMPQLSFETENKIDELGDRIDELRGEIIKGRG